MNLADAHEAQLLARGSGGALALGALVIALQCQQVPQPAAYPISFRQETPGTDSLNERVVIQASQGVAKASRIRALFARWAAEDPTHDQKVWKSVVEGVETHRLSDRRRFG